MNRKYPFYGKYKLAPDSVMRVRPHMLSFYTLLEQLSKSLVEALTAVQEPRVWQQRDRTGHSWWHVYDPVTKRSARFATETEVLIWLEQVLY
jgi:hypothetical protein